MADVFKPWFIDDFNYAKSRWNIYATDLNRIKLLKLLMRMEISEDQLERLLKDGRRVKSGLPLATDEVVNNPYLIVEKNQCLLDEDGKLISEKISRGTVDQAMIPDWLFILEASTSETTTDESWL